MNIVKHQIQLDNKPFFFFAPENDSVVPGTVVGMQKNNWKIGEVEFKPGDVFVDLGCSIGLVSMVFAKLYPFIKIYSLDANPVAIECLNLGITANDIKNIKCYNLAVGAESKKDVEFLTYNENESCLIQKELCTNQRLKSYKCDMIGISEIFDNFGIDKVKYLKWTLKLGSFQFFDFIYSKRPDILDRIDYLQLEIHPFDDSNPPSKALKEKVKITFGNRVIM